MNPPGEATPLLKLSGHDIPSLIAQAKSSYKTKLYGEVIESQTRELAQLQRQVAEGQALLSNILNLPIEAWIRRVDEGDVVFYGEFPRNMPTAIPLCIHPVYDCEDEGCPHYETIHSHSRKFDAFTTALAAERGKAFMEHGAAIAEWLNELYAVMVDPCAEGTMRVVDTKAAIMKSALATREELNRRANTQSALGSTDGDSNV